MKADGELREDTKPLSSKYLNNMTEQDHRGVKLRLRPMRSFRRFKTAAITIAGVELLCRMHKGNFDPSGPRLRVCPGSSFVST
jgi:transposase-like protein